jgi:hypothetical protein
MIPSFLIAGCFASLFAGQSDLSVTYVFKPDTDHFVSFLRGQFYLTGKLDSHGEFHFHSAFRVNAPRSIGNIPARGLGTIGPVYEFRSGVLIPGEMLIDGRFIPEVGGKIILFADYVYTPEARYIWNLPGWFEPVLVKK